MLPDDAVVSAGVVAAAYRSALSVPVVAGAALNAEAVASLVREHDPLLGGLAFEATVGEVLARLHGLGAIEPLLRADDVTEIMINGPGPVWAERSGHVSPTDIVLDRSAIDLLLERIVTPLGLRIDRMAPLVDARLADGSRVNAVVPPLAVDGPYVTIRRFSARPFVLSAFAEPPVAAMLAWTVRVRANIVVSGGTGAGKTSLLGALAANIDGAERVVTIEDAAELQLPGSHIVRLEARPANAEGIGGIDIRTLVRNALRMRPDRILVGEVRGAEALDMVQAMNTGHEGSLSSCHANGPADALRRLETMMLMAEVGLPFEVVREHLRSAVDLIVQVARLGGRRRIVEVVEVHPDHEVVLATGGEVVALPTFASRRDGGGAVSERPDPDWLTSGATT